MPAANAPDVAATGQDLRRLDRRVITAWWLYLGMWLAIVVAVAGVAALLASSAAPLLGGAILAAALAIGGAIVIPARYARFGYAFSPDALELQHGLWWRTRAAVPYHRIQHVDIEQGPIQRRLGLVSLHLRTAAASSVGGLPGLAADEADVLRSWLIARAGRADGA